ncbi:ATP-binding protein [Alteromonas flava]|uniref:ATP-binding protein n=1 Tax=Alteromonas flava TaxID=2048003 RepID=UPI000C292970|nr:ATP-binding protein [Alteromonas flava]
MYTEAEQLKHAYITAMVKALMLLLVPIIVITVYFNLVAAIRPQIVVIQLTMFGAMFLLYQCRHHLSSQALALKFSCLLMVVGWVNCYVNQSIAYAGIALMVSAFAIAVHNAVWVRWVLLLVTHIGLFASYALAFDFNFTLGPSRWLLVTLVGQLIVLQGMQFLFSKVEDFFTLEHQLRLDSEAALKEKSRFLANMSHEIRTPIAGISGLLQTVEVSNLDPQQQEKLKLVQQSASLLGQIVDDILDYSKIEAGKLTLTRTTFELTECLQQMVKLFEPMYTKQGNTLQLKTNWSQPIWINTDQTRLQQILLNLLSNANKFTQQGSVTINVQLTEVADDYVVTCQVTDTGIGIANEDIDKLFRPFQQLDDSSRKTIAGTGLGLLICQQLVTLLEGTIGVQSELGKGTKVSFNLPVKRAEQKAASATTDHDVDIRDCHILVAEDNAINQLVVEDMLANLGAKTITVENGEMVLELLKVKKRREIDLILMDCQMPVMDGYEATQKIRAGECGPWQEIPIIALTANALEGDKEACFAAGMTDYLTKPVDKSKLEQMIGQYFQRQKRQQPQPQAEA